MLNNLKKRDYQKIALLILCLMLIGISVYLYLQVRHQAPETPAQQAVFEKIAQTIELPAETPVSVTVNDKAKLSNQSLAERVENQDVLLIFNQAKRLVVYRPSTDKVIDMLTFTSPSEVPAANTKN